MPSELQALVFQFQAKATERDRDHDYDNESANSSSREKQRRILSDAVSNLNRQSDEIARDIEEEIQELLPPSTMVRAEVRFSRGSLVMTGTIAVFTWLGSIALKSTQASIEEELSGIIKVAVQRVFARTLRGTPFPIALNPTEASVTPQAPIEPDKQLANLPSTASATERRAGSSFPTIAVWIFLAIILILQIVILLDRFFILTWRP